MNEESHSLERSYRRAAAGLGLIAGGWLVAILLGRRADDLPVVWAIPVGAALLAIFFYSQSRRVGNNQE